MERHLLKCVHNQVFIYSTPMFLIKNAQLRQLAEHGIDRFIDQLLPFIEEEYPEEILLEDPAEVRQRLAAFNENYVF